MPQNQPEQQQPPVQRLRVRYAKRGRLRFTSHRDFGRAFERAIRRAGLPVAFSSGFSPHPRISYANASPTGAATEAEYLEIALREVVRPAEAQRMLSAQLPEGLDVLEVVVAGPGALADRLQASHWRIRLPGVTEADAAAAVTAFLERSEIEIQRMTKKGLRTFDCRGAVLRLSVSSEPESADSCAILEVVLRHGTPAVRPDDVLAGLREAGGLAPGQPPLQTRLAQGPLDPEKGTVGDPLAADRDVADATTAADG